MKKVRFIINPKSGTGKRGDIESIIRYNIDSSKIETEIFFTAYKNHAGELSKEAADKKYDAVIVVGGDGTIHEAGKEVINTDTALGIIPAGSGNGLAYNFNIPLNHVKAIRLINQFNTQRIDTGILNNIPFLSMAGLGFDAHIARIFETYGSRGFKSYLKISTREFPWFKPSEYELKYENKTVKHQAFVLNICNSRYYGNNAVIAPNAKANDGLLDVCILEKFPFYMLPMLVLQLFTHTIDRSRYMKVIQLKELTIKSPGQPIQIDGETYDINQDLNLKVQPLSLNLLVP